MTLYVESSAIIAWLLGEPQAERVRKLLVTARRVLGSVVTVTEAERALVRLETARLRRAGEVETLRQMLHHDAAAWDLLEVTPEVRQRAGRAFPVEPVRTLDAIHLATVLEFQKVYPDLGIASLDRRLLDNLVALGLVPAL